MTSPNSTKPKRIAWLTDLHLEFVKSFDRVQKLCKRIRIEKPDIVLVGGDTGTANSFVGYLEDLEHLIDKPIYFVLGNHDFYGSSIDRVKAEAQQLSEDSKKMRYLTRCGVVELTPTTALVGHDGWADGRLGSTDKSTIELNDFRLIEELKGLGAAERFAKLAALGDQAAAEAKSTLAQAFQKYQSVIFLTHVPPFKEACWHEGQISGDDFLPHFTSHAMGAVLFEIMETNPDKTLTVLCGHTHGQGKANILDNLNVQTGGAAYGYPKLQKIIEAH
ncbi:metallophosphoesterase [Pelagicoccus sp. SDUM812005]|uniref:metallophosphoesterase n=1 Tax=Pelagicoccus sp. SDUM812005 TaxID=3041257 RepID=UPI00280CD76F|nr:metallophosphoesterase [Pelagicoccus sp. SDUM812005]MDQ8182201.1 metallophosphoesterase [Pelagicoccus sp. SDUM812005]